MSSTELFKFDKNGIASNVGTVRNSWRGAMAIWQILERKYLPSLSKPIFSDNKEYYSRTTMSLCEGSSNSMEPIWNLFHDKSIPKNDRIVLGTTLDHVVVMRENIEETILAFESFDENTSLKDQSELLKTLLLDEDLLAIAWNQTSVCEDYWESHKYDKKEERYIPYNILTQSEHWSLFDEI